MELQKAQYQMISASVMAKKKNSMKNKVGREETSCAVTLLFLSAVAQVIHTKNRLQRSS